MTRHARLPELVRSVPAHTTHIADARADSPFRNIIYIIYSGKAAGCERQDCGQWREAGEPGVGRADRAAARGSRAEPLSIRPACGSPEHPLEDGCGSARKPRSGEHGGTRPAIAKERRRAGVTTMSDHTSVVGPSEFVRFSSNSLDDLPATLAHDLANCAVICHEPRCRASCERNRT